MYPVKIRNAATKARTINSLIWSQQHSIETCGGEDEYVDAPLGLEF
jgi:hypothetical protein